MDALRMTAWGEMGRAPLGADGEPLPPLVTTCGTCGRSWDDVLITSRTPAPAGRCPFEYDHPGPDAELACEGDVIYKLTAGDLEAHAGRRITRGEADRIRRALEHSTLGDTVAEVVFAVCGPAAEDEDGVTVTAGAGSCMFCGSPDAPHVNGIADPDAGTNRVCGDCWDERLR